MKKWTLLGLALLVTMSCVACVGPSSSGTGNKDSEIETNSQQSSESEKETSSEISTEPESDTEPETSTEVVDEKLKWFATEYFSEENYNTMANQFLTSVYDSPEKIELYKVFYNGARLDVTSEVTQAEREALEKHTEIPI